MDIHRKLFFNVILLLSCNIKMCLHGAPAEGSVLNTELTGQELVKMGNVMNKPLLSLLGATFVKTEQKVNKEFSKKIGDTEKKLLDGIDKITLDTSKEREILKMELCKQTRCAGWTEWSRCSAFKDETFGARSRSRKCGGNSSICSTKSSETVETDYQICQGKTCKHTLTKNNYCIKLYNSVSKSQKDAQDVCNKDGGHLMNINSNLTASDIEEYFNKISFRTHIWIDGTRQLPNGQWKYGYGPNHSFDIWYTGEPNTNDDCKIFYFSGSKWYWWGKPCTHHYYFLCEFL